MDLLLDNEQQQIVDATKSFVSDQLPIERLHGRDIPSSQLADDLWKGIAELGWLSMTLNEDSCGVGYSDVEECLVFRELGRMCSPPRILFTALAAKVAERSGCNELASRLARGETAAGYAAKENYGGHQSALSSRVFEYQDADYGLSMDDELAQLVDTRGVVFEPRLGLDRSVSMAISDLSDCPVVAETPVQPVHQSAVLLQAAMYVGMAEATTSMIVEYAKVRETFGKPIGSYQAVRHPCADMAIRAETARCQLFYASLVLSESEKCETSDVDLHVSSARVLAEQAACKNSDDNIQLHGGIGVTDEFTAHYFLKRAQTMRFWFATNREHLSTVLSTPMTPSR